MKKYHKRGNSGIYILKNKINDNVYVGMSKNFENRLKTHKEDLINNKHHQYKLQNEFNLLVESIKKENSKYDFCDYIDFKNYTFDKYYYMEIEESINYKKMSNLDEIKNIEDSYILKYRKLNYGYNQKTNREIELNFEENNKRIKQFSLSVDKEMVLQDLKISCFLPYEDFIIINNNNCEFKILYDDIYEILKSHDKFVIDCMYNYLYYFNDTQVLKKNIEFNIEDFKKYMSLYYYKMKQFDGVKMDRPTILKYLSFFKLTDLKSLSKINVVNLYIDYQELDTILLEYFKTNKVNITYIKNCKFEDTLVDKIDIIKSNIKKYNLELTKDDRLKKQRRESITKIINKFIEENNISIFTRENQASLNNIIPCEFRMKTLYQTLKGLAYSFKFFGSNFIITDCEINFTKPLT